MMGELAGLLGAMATLIALVVAYIQFVVKRSVLPSVEFDVAFEALLHDPTFCVGEVECILRNVGSSMVIVTKVNCRVRYWSASDSAPGSHDGFEPVFPHTLHPYNLTAQESGRISGSRGLKSEEPPLGPHAFFISQPRTFIQPGVQQSYRKPIALEPNVALLHVWASFDYRIQNGWITNNLAHVFLRPPPDLNWLDGIRKHTVRRTFRVDAVPSDMTASADLTFGVANARDTSEEEEHRARP